MSLLGKWAIRLPEQNRIRQATQMGLLRLTIVGALGLVACHRAAPVSRFPGSRELIDAVRSEQGCSRGLVGEANIDYIGDEGRIRARALYVMTRPASIRFDVMSPLGGVLSTLTSDGKQFAFDDRQNRTHLLGKANQCNLTEALRVPVPAEALTQLLSGQPPVLLHTPGQAQLTWNEGSYLVQITSTNRAVQRLRFLPRAEDWELPWQQQRVELLAVEVLQQGLPLYSVQLSQYRSTQTAEPRVDPDGLEPNVAPSGPQCEASLPGKVRFLVPGAGSDMLFEQQEVHHNPPLVPGIFRQQPSPGTQVRNSPCD